LILGNRITDLDVRCEYVLEGLFNLLLITRAYYDHAFGWKDWLNVMVDPFDESIIKAYAFRQRGVPFLHTISIRPSLPTKLNAPDCVAQAFSLATISPELTHFRLGHVSQPTAKINHHRIGEEVQGDQEFDCEPCKLAKSKKIISHTP
jgi:hypothetical protein